MKRSLQVHLRWRTRPMVTLAVSGLLVTGSFVAAGASTNLDAPGAQAATRPAGATAVDTRICEQYGSTTIQGRYVVQNNRWGSTAEQCIDVSDTGFTIATQQGSAPTNGAPVSYPSVFVGCHYTNCSPGTNLPIQVDRISSATSSINYRYVSGATYNASYDIWLDPTPRTDGVNQMEIMIWFTRQGPIQPIGSPVGTTTIGGRSWEVWRGSNGSNNVVSYLASTTISSWSFSVLDFVHDVRARGAITNSWYLTSIQAGFEPWQGGAGLGVDSFSAAVNGGGNPSPSPTATPTTPPPNPGACRVAYTPNSWPGGFTANVTVTNTSPQALNGWTLTYSLPAGQQVTTAWNATVTQNGSGVTARDLGWNAVVAPGATASFGYQGTLTGDYRSPTDFSLNGVTCALG